MRLFTQEFESSIRKMEFSSCVVLVSKVRLLADVDRQLDDAMVLAGLVVEAFQGPRARVAVAQAEPDVCRRDTRDIALPRADRRLQPTATCLCIHQNTHLPSYTVAVGGRRQHRPSPTSVGGIRET